LVWSNRFDRYLGLVCIVKTMSDARAPPAMTAAAMRGLVFSTTGRDPARHAVAAGTQLDNTATESRA
jgi:hypothetical protein